jgi:cytochrome oxidase Cu insertion factor (SCO1/SenC/PrrC family)
MSNMRKVKYMAAAAAVVVVVAAGAGVWGLLKAKQAQNKEAALENKIFVTKSSGSVTAPNFQLTDQHGKSVSLAEQRGKVVLLQFLDPECTDVCPLVSQEMLLADKAIAAKSKDVEYLAVNVNENHNSQKDVLDYSNEHGLDGLPNWHFLTGTPDQLKAVWKSYGIDVIPSKDGDVQHSTDMYFIDRSLKERYVAYPDNSKASIADWGEGIALYMNKLI